MEENNINPIQNPNQVQTKTNGLNIAALVLGIVSIVLWCLWYISIPCAIIALVFGIIGIKKQGKGFALTGIITGALVLVVWVLFFSIAFMYGFTLGLEEGLADYDNKNYEYSSYRY